MKKFTVAVLLIPLLFCFSSCSKKPEQANEEKVETREQEGGAGLPDKDELLARGGKASSALMKSLGTKLKGALKEGGPVHALDVCKTLAVPSTEAVSGDFEGLTISRVSLKPRNPGNTADGLDKKILQDWEDHLATGEGAPADEVHYRDDGTAVFYRPIMTQDVCMNCHGEPAAFPEQLTARLNELYPDDQATGYQTGQLRGAFRVAFTAAE